MKYFQKSKEKLIPAPQLQRLKHFGTKSTIPNRLSEAEVRTVATEPIAGRLHKAPDVKANMFKVKLFQ